MDPGSDLIFETLKEEKKHIKKLILIYKNKLEHKGSETLGSGSIKLNGRGSGSIKLNGRGSGS